MQSVLQAQEQRRERQRRTQMRRAHHTQQQDQAFIHQVRLRAEARDTAAFAQHCAEAEEELRRRSKVTVLSGDPGQPHDSLLAGGAGDSMREQDGADMQQRNRVSDVDGAMAARLQQHLKLERERARLGAAATQSVREMRKRHAINAIPRRRLLDAWGNDDA
jgi:hypothetical protein